MKFKVSAILPIPAEIYFIERDSSAFRSLVAEVSLRSTVSTEGTYTGHKREKDQLHKNDSERLLLLG